MHQLKTWRLALLAGTSSVLIGLVSFALHWSLWDFWHGPMPGIQVLLFPGNLTLVYLWHPLFSEELGFWPKLMLQTLGQFAIVTAITATILGVIRQLKR